MGHGLIKCLHLRLLDLDHVDDGSLLVHLHDSAGISEDLDNRLGGRVFDFETTSSLLNGDSFVRDNAEESFSLLRGDLHVRAFPALHSMTVI